MTHDGLIETGGFDRWEPPVAAESDRDVAAGLIRHLLADDQVQVVVIPGEPPSKARPRFTMVNGKPRTYTPQVTIAGEQRLALYLRRIHKYEGNVAVGVVFYRSNKQRIDVDNMQKALLDSATRAGCWDDDSQVTALCSIVELDPAEPRIVVAFGRHQSTLTRGADAMATCTGCGKRFTVLNPARAVPLFCSRACRTTNLTRTCDHCGASYKPHVSSWSKFCSVDCRKEHIRVTRKAARRLERSETCGRGHPWTPASTYFNVKDDRRRCRICDAENAARRRASNQLELSA